MASRRGQIPRLFFTLARPQPRTLALLISSTSRALSAPSLCMSLPNVAIDTSGFTAPSDTIICWQTGFSANIDSAPVAAACTSSTSDC